jgi:hypothetical protein
MLGPQKQYSHKRINGAEHEKISEAPHRKALVCRNSCGEAGNSVVVVIADRLRIAGL